MATLFVLIPLAMVFVFIAIGAFVWAARSGQFDDMETPRVRVLFDDEDAPGEASAPLSTDAPSGAGRDARSPGASDHPR